MIGVQVYSEAKSNGKWLQPATVADRLNRTALPRPDTLRAYASACGLPPEQQHRWEAKRARLAKRPGHGVERAGSAVDDSSPARSTLSLTGTA